MVSGTKLGVTTYTTPTDTQLLITRVFDAPRAIVFDAWTSPKHVPQWLLGPEGWTMPVCEVDLRPGGSWRYVWRKGDDTEMAMTGKYREVAPPERVVWTESWGAEWPETLNTLVLSETGGRTTASLTITYVSKQARDAALQTGMKDGMGASFDRLAEVVASMASRGTA